MPPVFLGHREELIVYEAVLLD